MADYTQRIQVNMSSHLRDKVAVKADLLGVSIPEYVRYILIREFETDTDKKIEKGLHEAFEDIKEGNVIETKDIKESIQVLRDVNLNE